MDIVRRAYLHAVEKAGVLTEDVLYHSYVTQFKEAVEDEVKRLIRVRAYSSRDWPREWGPLPDELRAKSRKKVI